MKTNPQSEIWLRHYKIQSISPNNVTFLNTTGFVAYNLRLIDLHYLELNRKVGKRTYEHVRPAKPKKEK